MEGSAIARNSSVRSIGSNPKGQNGHPGMRDKLKGNTQPKPSIGSDGFAERNSRNKISIKGGQNG